MFTKQEIMDRWAAEKQAAHLAGRPEPKAGLNLALLILSSALFHQKQWSGEDYASHPIRVGFNNTRSTVKQIIGVLHDVPEDSDWTVEDFEEMGFPSRVLRGVRGLTRNPNEPYFDFIERGSREGEDTIDKKIEDIEHNSTGTRAKSAGMDERAALKQQAYNVSYHYLVDVKKGKVAPGSSIVDYMRADPVFSSNPALMNRLLDTFSSRPERLPLNAALRSEFAAPHA